MSSSSEGAEKEISEKLKELQEVISKAESLLHKVEKSSSLSNEDQLFFGFVVSLALLLLTIPSFDIATIFESFGLTIKPASGILKTKDLLILILIISSSLRYLATISGDNVQKGNKRRMMSVELLLFSFYFWLMELLFRGLGSLLESINVSLLLIPPIILAVFAWFLGAHTEKKWLRLYHHKESHVSFIFTGIGLGILISYFLRIFVSNWIPLSLPIDILLIYISFTIAAITMKYLGKRF